MSKKTASGSQKELIEEEVNSNIIVDFSCPTCWGSTRYDCFTNYLREDDCFFKYHSKIFFDLIPKISKYKFSNIYSEIKHYHIISNKKTLDMIKTIFINIYMETKNVDKRLALDYYNQNFNESAIYQIGDIGSLRLIGVKDGYHHFKILFIDYYHLLFPDENYNEQDTDKYYMSLHERGK